MKLSLKALLLKSLTIATLAGAVALVVPAKAEAQGFGVAVQFSPRYDDPFRRDDWRRHEEWVRQQEWLRHEQWDQWERDHRFYNRPQAGPYGPAPFPRYGR